MVLTPPKPGEPPFKIVKASPTPSGHSLKEIAKVESEEHVQLKSACLKVADYYATSDIYHVVQDNLNDLADLMVSITRHRPAPSTDAVRRPVFRAVVNLISSFRMFSDHLDREAKARFGEQVADALRQRLAKNMTQVFLTDCATN